uniref:Ig-like domain-containing protein n=1 Tax=Otus sunia TaxID=257818 RepID=A0A8C8AT44_9STRI
YWQYLWPQLLGLLIIWFLLFSFLDGFAQEIPVQSPISITKFQKSARMTCEIQTSAASFDGIVIHWYQQKEGKGPERLLFYSGGKISVESGFRADRYMIETVSSQNRCVFTIKDVIPDDAATYYCLMSSFSLPSLSKSLKLSALLLEHMCSIN